MRPFLLVSVIAYVSIVLYGLVRRRSRFYSLFAAVILGIHTMSSSLLEPVLTSYGPWAVALLWWGQLSTYLYFARMVRRSSQHRAYRYLIALPASWFAASAFIALPWALLAGAGFQPWWPWLPFVIGSFGFV